MQNRQSNIPPPFSFVFHFLEKCLSLLSFAQKQQHHMQNFLKYKGVGKTPDLWPHLYRTNILRLWPCWAVMHLTPSGRNTGANVISLRHPAGQSVTAKHRHRMWPNDCPSSSSSAICSSSSVFNTRNTLPLFLPVYKSLILPYHPTWISSLGT